MSKIGIDIADTVIDVWPSLIKKAKQFNLEHSNNKSAKFKDVKIDIVSEPKFGALSFNFSISLFT